MAAPGAAAQLPASSISTGLSVDDEVKEYEKILKLRDEIFSGNHPRLKVAQQFVRKPARRDPQGPPPAKEQVPKHGLDGSTSERHPESAARGKQPANVPSVAKEPSGPTATSRSSRAPTKPSSEIDPIFLTKSEELVRAELQLQRGRLERTLREQIDQRRQESRQKVALQDAKPEFDVTEVLGKALELVRHSPSSETYGPPKAPSDSLDENSFYSSRAPDSPPVTNRQWPSPRHTHPENLAADAPVDRFADELQRLEALNNSGTDQEMQDAYPVADHRLPYRRRPSYKAYEGFVANKFPQSQQQTDAFEEPEYSPPAPGVPPMGTDSREYQSALTSGARRPEPSYQLPDRRRYGRGSLSPPGDMTIVRNHITSPAAPRPSRVSPLATAKVPKAQRLKESLPAAYGQDRVRAEQETARSSPEGPAPASRLMPRKRRRVQEERDGSRRVSSRRQAVDPSEPHIKQEPVSPPPFADDPPNIRARVPQERPVYIDIASPRYTPVIERREPAYEIDPYDVHEPGVSRAASRVSVRRPVRDDQDLRRVASLHHARQPEYIREYVDRPSQPSVQIPYPVERPPQEKARYYDEAPVTYSRRYVPMDEPISPGYRDAYYEEDASPRVMAPPPRRIVVDEQGRQYYEVLPAPRMQSVIPPYSRVPRSDIYDENAPPHQQSARATSIVGDPYSGRRYMQEMPPPRQTYRRVTDYPRPVPTERPSYPMPLENREVIPRSASLQVADHPARRTAYIDDEAPRERIVRMSSVRPPTVRYEDPREMVPHMEPVHPASRAVSTYVDDDRRPREYIERPVYADARPAREERYYDSDGSAVFMRT